MWFTVGLLVVATVLNQDVANFGDVPSSAVADAAIRKT
jgi:hypothetical protein